MGIDMQRVTHLEVRAKVRYWEDADVNGECDEDGSRIPFGNGELWCPRIRLADGYIEGWPQGTTADIHYKVCDEGEYWLTESGGARVAKWSGYYVPDALLCHGDDGCGDYIIFKVGADGVIANYHRPVFEAEQWVKP